MTKLTEEQMAKGRKRFLDQNPAIARQIEGLSQQEADAMGISLESLRAAETMKALSKYAYERRQDSQELFLGCVADSAEEFTQMNTARLQSIQRAIGL